MKIIKNKKVLWTPLVFCFIITISFTVAFAQQSNTVFKVGDLVQGVVYGIKVTKVTRVERRLFGYNPIKSDHILLELGVEFFKNGIPLKELTVEEEGLSTEEAARHKEMINCISNLSVINAEGKVYRASVTREDNKIVYYIRTEMEGDEVVYTNKYTILISVPNSSNALRLRYRDLPLINLDK